MLVPLMMKPCTQNIVSTSVVVKQLDIIFVVNITRQKYNASSIYNNKWKTNTNRQDILVVLHVGMWSIIATTQLQVGISLWPKYDNSFVTHISNTLRSRMDNDML